MRLIDADKLEGEAICLYTYGGARYIPLDALKRAPTVDAIIVPCPYGTLLYRICEEGNERKPFIREVRFNRGNFCRIVFDGEMGRTVFLTREEAEAAIADRR